MYFDAEAFAEGIVAHAAGSSIESLLDNIDYTIEMLHNRVESMDEDEQEALDALIVDWRELFNEIKRQNAEFEEEEDEQE